MDDYDPITAMQKTIQLVISRLERLARDHQQWHHQGDRTVLRNGH